MEKFKKVMGIIWKVYSIFCVCLMTILIIAALVIWANFGKITGKALEFALDNFGTEINSAVSSFMAGAITDDSVKFNSIKTIPGGGLQADFTVNSSVVSAEEIAEYASKTNEELLEEFGITVKDIPDNILPILSMVEQTLVLDFKDSSGKPVLSREISAAEIKKLLGK